MKFDRFREKHNDLFFGRDRENHDLKQKHKQESKVEHFSAVSFFIFYLFIKHSYKKSMLEKYISFASPGVFFNSLIYHIFTIYHFIVNYQNILNC